MQALPGQEGFFDKLFAPGKYVRGKISQGTRIYRIKIKIVSLKTLEIMVQKAEVWEITVGGHKVIDRFPKMEGRKIQITESNINKVYPELEREIQKSKYGKLKVDFGGDAAAAMHQFRKRLEAKNK